jgi:2-oxoglutarate ferredoxin oxidoreductase subunit beta
VVRLHKANDEYDIEDRQSALQAIAQHSSAGGILTGLLYINRDGEELHDALGTARRPLNTLAQKELCPGSRFLDSINDGLR